MTSVHLLFFLCCYLSTICIAINNITTSIFLEDDESIISNNGEFKLGFFSPTNSTNRYIGIWFNKVPTKDVFWVANRNKPLNDSSGVMKISADGNLQVLNGRNNILWSSNMSNNASSAQLLDSGNLVLLTYNRTMIWQSIDHPTDSLMPNTKLTITNSNMKNALQPWKGPSDPSYGRFSVGTDSFTHSQVVIWDGDRPHWRSGPWNGNIFLGLVYTDEARNYANTYIRQNDRDVTVDFVYTGASTLAYSHYSFSYDGTISEKWWDGSKWQYVWGAPVTECDMYGYCGSFGTCNPSNSPVCRCLKGFIPRNPEEWRRGNWSSGCVRRVMLQCAIQGSKEDGFLQLRNVKVPDRTEWSVGLNQVDCRSQCLNNCSCLAYAYDAGAGCMYWSKDLIDIQEFPSGGLELYLRLPHSELGTGNRQKVIIVVTAIIGTIGVAASIYVLWRLMSQRKVRRKKKEQHENFKNDGNGYQNQLEELPLFEFKRLAMATNDFQDSNKLGQGGFGPVYKGTLEDGVQIAVKRLSAASGQGLEELMNEILVISKLQHRNLVKLLGGCVENNEKMLIYEYMPNKSLDFFLFDPDKRELLNWEKRFTIIEGISRGLVYLHRDSRLRIIHRDLKASNILLDEDLIPKISDFGMARIFSQKQDQDNTRRVVGTYGYMSPEYAMEGHFSEKSDVYSFGVLLLEIMTGKKNNSFWLDEQSLTLLGYVWKLWNEDALKSVIDPLITEPDFSPEILRCIHVGLLCVQEFPGDRPNTSTLLSMIVSDIVDLPSPKQPGFTRRLVSSDTESTQSRGQQSSASSNYVSITHLSGRIWSFAMAGGRWKKNSGVVSSSSEVDENRASLERPREASPEVKAKERSGGEARAESSRGVGITGRFPVRPLFPRRWEEADPLGRLTPLFNDKTDIAGPDGTEVDVNWLVEARKGHYHRLAEDLYEACEGTRPPPGFIAVYLHHFDYGLRFPLDPFIARLLNEYNISLAQLTSKSMRHIIRYRWMCDYLSYPPSIEVFQEMHELVRNSNDAHGWWTITNKRSRKGKRNYLNVFPYVSSVHEWKTHLLLVRVPVDPKHSYYYSPPKWFVRVDPTMSRVGSVDPENTDHVVLLEWFEREHLGSLKQGEVVVDSEVLGYKTDDNEILVRCPPHDFIKSVLYFCITCIEIRESQSASMTSAYLLFFLCCYLSTICIAINNITASIFLEDDESIISNNGEFKLGFFSPTNSTNRYIGIWFNKVPTKDVFWVANRNNPLKDSSGLMKVSSDGNLQVLNGRNDILWSSNMSNNATSSVSAQLLDSGNLVLLTYNETMIWQSIDHPTDSLMPNTILTITNSNIKNALQSWKGPSDTSYGRFSLGTDSFTHSQVVIWDGDRPHWRSGPWNGNIFLGLVYTDEARNYANTYIRQNDRDGTVDLVYAGASTLAYSHYSFSYDGTISEKWWDGSKWQYVWGAPVTECDMYGYCGTFGTCNPSNSPVCKCLKGFIPRNPEEWRRGNWSSGCVRRVMLQCGIQGSKEDGFVQLRNVKVPDLTEWSVGLNQVDCRSQCLNNCSCLAYAYDAGAGCMYWSKDLIDIQEFPSGGLDLFLRLPHSELGTGNRQMVIVMVTAIIGTIGVAASIYGLWRLMSQRKVRRKKKEQLDNFKNDGNGYQNQLEELPLFEFKRLAMATNDFQDSNKLGQGGFGPVYKGTLEDGVQIAVKRLSAASGQGLEEFMNEILVISKLQHRNLVKLLGGCVENNEKMLIYEYMPNKSLDFFLFDPDKRELLNWERRFTIIEGISRGLVYLHRDSRLRIIHRDLKASNILLDEDLIPKISDFGMARIFSQKQDQDNTRRVVGTYGYMSPEYAMEGHFSEKSDVYSFGVLLLEIMTGKKNNSFWLDEQSLTLLGYVWKLWNEDALKSVIDPLITDAVFSPEILRCIHVGLLCVQEFPGDRPNTSTLLSMIVSDIVDLPSPKQPGFTRRLVSSDTESTQSRGQQSSASPSSNYVSITHMSGR
ncbi:uncharacterized protein [Spinacia oleracea]|uniref:non-specific serine/threonine protein kinase n=1 Tax=Spinacia oleracea TaxID=3562 RepID=A0ABM3R435_SPIOL|nr:uncharacterized protein LOC110786703 [Spinacia oleracea]